MSLRARIETALGPAYRVERELGGGGMSHVFVAEEVALGRRVVVKVLPPEMAATVNAERFEREIRTLASLQHPNVVPLITAGGQGDLLWFTMPLVEGEELRARLAREGALPIADALRIWGDMLDALAYAHAKGVIHRDIKPENVLVSGRHALVADFGVSKALADAAGGRSATMTGLSIGTPAYMSPEQAMADPTTDHRSDIYAAGLVMYEMLAGKGPFGERTPVQMVVAHATEEPAPVGALRAEVSEALADLVMRCLAKAPGERPASAAAVLAEIARLPDANRSGAGVASVTSGGVPAAAPAPRRSRGRLFVVGGVVLAAVAAGAFFVAPRMGFGGPPRPMADSARLSVFVLPVVADAADSLLSRSIADAITAPLRNDQRMLVTTVDELPFLGPSGRAFTRDSLLLWMADVGTQSHVTITLARAGTGYVASIAAIATATNTALVNEQRAAGTAAELPKAVSELAEITSRVLGRAVGTLARPAPTGVFTRSSASVARLIRDAQSAAASREQLAAAELYRAAIREDATHPMANIGLYWALTNAGVGTDERLRAIAVADRHSDRMPFPEAARIIHEEYLRAIGDLENALAAFLTTERTLAGIGTSNQLGLLYATLRRYEDAARVFAQLRDTTYVAPWFANSNYATALLDLGREEEARRELEALVKGAGPSHPVTRTVTYALLHYHRNADSAVVLATADLAAARSPGQRSAASGRLLLALQTVGRLRESGRLRLERAEQLAGVRHPATRLASKLSHADDLVTATGDTTAALRIIDEAMRETPFESLAPMDRPFSTAIQTLSHVGRLAEAQRISEAADREIPAEFKRVFAPNLAATRLELELARGDGQAALVQARLADVGACAPCRFVDNARVWDLIGRADSALTWYERYLDVKSSRVAGFDAGYLASSYRRAGELHEARGDARKALERYRQFVELWRNADPDLQPQVEAVRARIRALEAKIG